MTVPGAFFEVTGTMSQLSRIYECLESTGGRLTSGDSASCDLWMEMLDEWFEIHDREVRLRSLDAKPVLADDVARAFIDEYHQRPGFFDTLYDNAHNDGPRTNSLRAAQAVLNLW